MLRLLVGVAIGAVLAGSATWLWTSRVSVFGPGQLTSTEDCMAALDRQLNDGNGYHLTPDENAALTAQFGKCAKEGLVTSARMQQFEASYYSRPAG